MSYEDFRAFLETSKIDLQVFSPEEIREFSDQIAERKGKIEKASLVRLIKNDQDG